MLLSLLLLLSLFVPNSISGTAFTEVRWSGGSPLCDSSLCNPGYLCMQSYVCDTVSSQDLWNNGTQFFTDPIPLGYGTLSMITVTVSGVFGCPSPSFFGEDEEKVDIPPVKSFTLAVYLDGHWLGTIQADTTPIESCDCKNCANTVIYTRYVTNWPSYAYGGPNSVQVVPALPSCLSSVGLFLTYDNIPPDSTTSSLSSTTGPDLTSTGSTYGTGKVTTTTTTTTGNTTTTTGSDNTHALIVMGSFMLGGMVCVNVLLLGGWYVWRKHKEYNPSSGGGGGASGHRSRHRSLYDKAVAFSDIVIGERIGRGSFGEVYRGVWLQTDVAVKKLPADILNNQALVEEFNQEVRLLRSLMHPNILQFMGACLLPPDICLITEYIPRGDLYKIIHDATVNLDWALIKKISIDVARGMHYLHGSNPVIIHRDLKSHNVLIGEHWNAKVADFGLCKIIRDQYPKGKFTPCGTPKWAAPEVLRNEVYTTKADIYSFGIILWEMATRQDVFPGMSAFELIMQVGRNGLRPNIPPDTYAPLASLIVECWDADPDKRPNFERILTILEST